MTGIAKGILGLVLTLAPFLVRPASAQVSKGLAITAPAAPGGGWDQLARTLQRVLDSTSLAPGTHVENVPGAAGTIGLARFVSSKHGDSRSLLVTGLVMLGGIASNHSPVTLEQTTPIARLTGEWEVLAVPTSSPYTSLGSLMTALRRAPGSVSWGGGSAGGTDQILVDLIAEGVGVLPSRTNYVAFSGGGEAVTALLGGQVSVGVSGWSEFAPHLTSGRLRALAISSPQRLPGIDVPTLRELGIPVDLANWRGVVAPAGLSPADRVQLIATLEQLVRTPAWHAELQRRGWSDLWLPGDAFARFLRAEGSRVNAIAARRRGAGAPVRDEAPRVSLASVGVWGTILTLLLLGIRRLRSRQSPSLVQPPPGSRRPLLHIAVGMVLNLVLAPWTGFVVASTVLYYLTARAFGDPYRVRNLLSAVLFATGVYVTFTYLLGMPLPVGRMWGGG
ncbi:MAG: tripartite tricarboxylate transporter substrate-binding protein [Gemmatimonadaceae bacterium]